MADIDVRTNIDAVLARMRTHAKDVVAKAVPRALNRTAERAVTQSSRDMRAEGYNFSASEIKAAMRIVRASQGKAITLIKVRRKTKSLMEFGPRESKAGVTVKVHGARKLIKGAFIAQRLNGKQGVFIEDKAAGKIIIRRAKQYKKGSKGGWQSYPARKLYGPSVGGSYSTERIQRTLGEFIHTTFEERLAHEIAYLSR